MGELEQVPLELIGAFERARLKSVSMYANQSAHWVLKRRLAAVHALYVTFTIHGLATY